MKRALGQSRELFLCIEREEDANKAKQLELGFIFV